MNTNGKADRPEREPALGEATAEQTMNNHDAEIDGPVTLDPAAQALIGRHLQTMYGEVVHQEVPEHLLKLLDELERKERQQ